MGGVNANVQKLLGVQHIKLHVHGELVVHPIQLHAHGDRDGHDLGLGGGVGEGQGLGAGSRHGVAGGVGAQNHRAVGGIGHVGHLGVLGLAVEYGGGELQRLAGDGGRGAAFHAGDAQLQGLAHPHRGCDGQVAISLGDADVIVAVCGLQGAGELPGCQHSGVIPGVSHLAGIDNDLHLGDGVGRVRVRNLHVQIQRLRHLLHHRAQRQAVDGVVQLQVFILCGVHPQIPNGLIQALLREVVGENDIPGIVGVAPAALVVVLVVGGGHMPALVQGQGVLLIAGVIATGANGPLAIAHFH